MKLLFDQNLAARLVVDLRDEFPESEHVHVAGLAKASDDEIWQYAKLNKLAIV